VKAVAIALTLALGAAAGSSAANPPLAMAVRVLTYNIHHGEGMDGEWDLARLARIISSTQPDLVSLQEVDQDTQRSGGVRQLDELARLTGLHPTFGRAMDYRGGEYGVGILSRWAPVSVENRPLPGTEDSEPRTALTVGIDAGPGVPRFFFTASHFESGPNGESRLAQAQAINQRLATDDELRILAGDLNSAAESDPMFVLRTRWAEIVPSDPVTPANGRPRLRADYILVRPASRWQVVDASVIDAPIASDHAPILSVLELR
jgi:endonuclease/exonuclease/phosphatase family metal-dependent hydrolase